MCQFVESMRVFNNAIEHVSYHNRRMNRTRKELFGSTDELDLLDFMKLPNDLDPECVYKARVLYAQDLIAQEYHPYTPRRVQSLKLVHTDGDYKHKAVDRSVLDSLMEQRGGADNILIVKDGLITDTAYSNVALFDGEQWITPTTYLLPGTARARLLEEGVLQECLVTEQDLSNFTELKMINAMLPFDETPSIPISAVIV